MLPLTNNNPDRRLDTRDYSLSLDPVVFNPDSIEPQGFGRGLDRQYVINFENKAFYSVLNKAQSSSKANQCAWFT